MKLGELKEKNPKDRYLYCGTETHLFIIDTEHDFYSRNYDLDWVTHEHDFVLSSEFIEDKNEKESRIVELEEKLAKAASLENKLRSSLTNKGKEIAAVSGRMADMQRKIAESDSSSAPKVETASH